MPTPAPAEYAPSTRYRGGDRDPAAQQEHTRQSREWRRRLSDAIFDDVTRELLVLAVRRTGNLDEAADRVGVTTSMVYGRMRWDVELANHIEVLLAELCEKNPRCGTLWGYRVWGGRCRDCRDAKAVDRGDQQKPSG